MKKNKIFIFGCQRSGTTLLRYILDSHSEISSPPESKFIFPLIKEVYENDISNKALDSMNISNKEFNQNFSNFINYFLNNYSYKKKKLIWADKSNHHLYILNSLNKIFKKSESKYISLIRDGIDVSYSFLNYKKHTFKFIDYSNKKSILNSSLKHWIDYNTLLKKNIKRYKIYLIQYENLVKKPNVEINKLCKSLKIKFEKEMINYGKFKHESGFGDKNVLKFKKPVSRNPSNCEFFFEDDLISKYKKLMNFFYN